MRFAEAGRGSGGVDAGAPYVHMNIRSRLLSSSIGKKYILAVTGGILFGFVIVHLLGNLQVFLGPGPLNAYAHFLQSKPGLVWAARFFLLAVVSIHVFMATQLSLENWAARPVPYACRDAVEASYASRTMLVTGLVVGAFLVFHLLHFTVKALHPEYAGLRTPEGYADVYRMMVLGFSRGWISLVYIVGVGLLSYHLSHGISSMFQSIGLRNQYYGRILDHLANGIALLYFLGNVSMPLAVLTGVLR
jgi:succinate dehydrogenase / fumarate reductase cytochrome b subunit